MTTSRSSRTQRYAFLHGSRIIAAEAGFRCRHCGLEVSCDPVFAGVQNRNHCPYCLWSRHLDGRTPGDRLAGCRAPMEPVGLTLKRSRNKYASDRDGELMLIHRCTNCTKVAINRIAADDNTAVIVDVFAQSCVDAADLGVYLAAQGIELLIEEDVEVVDERLCGRRI